MRGVGIIHYAKLHLFFTSVANFILLLYMEEMNRCPEVIPDGKQKTPDTVMRRRESYVVYVSLSVIG